MRWTGRAAAAVLPFALWAACGVVPAQAIPPGQRAALALAQIIRTAARRDAHSNGLAVQRTRRAGLQTLTVWYVADPGVYADGGAYRLRAISSGREVLAVSVASFAQAHPYSVGRQPENAPTLEIAFMRETVRQRTYWELHEQTLGNSCGYHAVTPPGPCPGEGAAKTTLDVDAAEAARYETEAEELVAAARRHAPV